MATVLSIDFDIIIPNMIDIWNNEINDKIKIENYEKTFPVLNFLNYVDFNIYKNLTIFLLKFLKTKDKEKVFFIEDHHQIIDIFNSIEDRYNNILINVDHHHDVGYCIDFNKLLTKNEVRCGNWVKFLKDNKIINQYCWVKNYNSIIIDVPKSYIDKEFFIYESFDNLINLIESIDYVVICSSFDWVPNNCRELFELWKEIYNNF